MLAFHFLNLGIGEGVVGLGGVERGHDDDVLPEWGKRVKPWFVCWYPCPYTSMIVGGRI